MLDFGTSCVNYKWEVVKTVKVPGKLIKETKAIIRLYLFLRHDCGLKEADKLNAKDLKEVLKAFLEK